MTAILVTVAVVETISLALAAREWWWARADARWQRKLDRGEVEWR